MYTIQHAQNTIQIQYLGIVLKEMGHNQGIPLAEQCPEREVVKSSLVQGTELGKKRNPDIPLYIRIQRDVCACASVRLSTSACVRVCESMVIVIQYTYCNV